MAVPLIFELVFVSGLVFSLKQTEQQIEKQLRSQELVAQTYILMRELVSSSFDITFKFLSDQSAPPLDQAKSNVIDTISSLRKVVGDDDRLQQSAVQIRHSVETFFGSLERFSAMSPGDLVYGDSGKETMLEIRRDMQLIDRAVRKFRMLATTAHEVDLDEPVEANWKSMLLAGLLLNLVLTIVLALSFARSISLRLRKLAENTRRVSRNLPPLPPLGGSDEVSDLDLVIHKMSAQLRFAEMQRSQLTSMLKNKLSEPLNESKAILIGLAESAAMTPPGKKAASKASQVLERLVGLLEDLTAIEQIESGRIELKKKELNSADLVLKANESVQSLAAKRHIKLLSSGDNQQFNGDGERITQVLINLLSNAIKFSPENASISVAVAADHGAIEFRVKDQGPGIPKEAQAKIFERYEQTKREDATARGGAGLGLNICSVIASSHGGALGVDSEPGQGSEFWLRLPRTDGAKIELPERNSEASLQSKQQEQAKHNSARGFKIWQKGLIVVAIPLVFQICFVAVLGSQLENAQRQVVREMQAKTLTTIVNEMYRLVINLALTAGGGYVAHADVSAYEKVAHSRETCNLLVQFVNLFELVRNDPQSSRQASALFESSERVFLTTNRLMLDPPPGKTIGALALLKKRIAAIQKSNNIFAERISQLVARQEKIELESPALRARTREQISTSIWIAVIVSVSLSVLLGLFFSRSITKRLSTLIENTLRFTQGKDELLPELNGADELVEFDKDFRVMLARIRENQEFKKHILAVVSHELRTPLTAISGSILLLNDGAYGELSETDLAAVQKAQKDILLVIQLVNDLLDIERMEAAKFPMEIKAVDLLSALEAAVASSNKQYPEMSFTFKSALADSPLISADPDLLGKAVSKLLLFCSAGENQKGASLELVKENSAFLLKVQDNANWLANGDAQLFDKFQLLEREDMQDKMSVALSLALSKIIFTQMGFEMSSTPPSAAGPGAFVVRIPE